MPVVRDSLVFLSSLSEIEPLKAKEFIEDSILVRELIKVFPEVAKEANEPYISAFEYTTRCFSLRFLERFCEYFGFTETRRKKEKKTVDEAHTMCSSIFESCIKLLDSTDPSRRLVTSFPEMIETKEIKKESC